MFALAHTSHGSLLLVLQLCAKNKRRKKIAHPSTHRTGHINAKYHHGALVALTTGSCCCRRRADHVSNIWLSRNLLSQDVNNVPLVTELAQPNLQKTYTGWTKI